MKKILVLFFMSVLLFACKNSSKPEDSPEQVLLKQLKDSIDNVVMSMYSSMSDFADETAKDKAINEAKIRNVFKKWLADFPEIVDCAYITEKGIMLYLEPEEYHKYEGVDISNQEQIIRMWQTKKPVMSALFLAVEGFYACDMQVPFYFDNILAGSYSMLIKPEILFNKIIKPAIKSDIDAIFVMESKGTILWDVDTTQLGKNAFTDSLYAQYTELLNAAHKISKEEKGNTDYQFLDKSKSKVVTKTVWWLTLNYYGTEWKLCLVKEKK